MPTIPEPQAARAVLDEVQTTLRAWAAAHPEATLYDMEVATERQVARVRAALVGDLVARVGATPTRPPCPSCGTPLQHVGTQARTVVLPHDEALTVQGPRYRCPACGAGFFPPG